MLSKLIAPPLCLACGGDAGRAAPLCRDCRGQLQPARQVAGACFAAFAYEGPAGALVRALKFRGRTAVADAMAAQLVARVPPVLLTGVVVPVPVHPKHRRRRGVDHAHALAAAVARRAGLELSHCLERGGDPLPQVGRGRTARLSGPPGSIRVCGSAPDTALLVDDVVTTGATLAACAAVLRAAGAREIAAIAYARTTAR
ncbi:MAG: hypothetical protein QOJ29_256 [Thermoleophilaceae bacterium]|jgi:ComF family protein|nr:hypothetical protein [Thermoleophilaceae bacterium]